MQTQYFASLNPPAVYRFDSLGLLEDVFEAVPDRPSWTASTTAAAEVRATSVPVTEWDAQVILDAWTRRGASLEAADAAGPQVVPSAPPAASVSVAEPQPAAIDLRGDPQPIPAEKPLWVAPTPEQVAAEERQVWLSRQEVLATFRDIGGGSAEARVAVSWS